MALGRARRLLVLALALGVVWAGMPGFSGATFTTSTRSSGSVSAAHDWTPPWVAVASPSAGATVSGTVALTAVAGDARSGLASVLLQQGSEAAGFTTVCVDTTAPYACSWDTTRVVDGPRSVRAVALDEAGNGATSAGVWVTVANSPSVLLASPGDVVRGTVPLTSVVTDPAHLTVTSHHLEVSPADAGTWTTIAGCTTTVATLTCSWTASTGSYDLRAVAVVGGATVTDVVPDILVDNVAPTVTMTDPGAVLSGTVTLSASAEDADSGIAAVVIERAAAGTSVWTPTCSIGAAPYSCRFATTGVTDGSYDLRAVATDQAGNLTTSGVVKKVTVNNSIASASVESPGAYVSGTVTLLANANSTNGVASVAIQRAPHGTSTFTTICTDTAAPYTCDWVTSATADGPSDLRAVLTDRRGLVLTSALVVTTVDNSPLRALDVQSVNRGVAVGKIEAGDQLVLTYAGQVAPSSVVAGWDGSVRAVTVRVRDGQLVAGGTTSDDTLAVDGLSLGEVNLHGNYVKRRKTVTFASTMTLTAGAGGTTVVTVTLGAPSMGLPTSPAAGSMVWTPSTAARTPGGTPCSATPVVETGASDKDF